MKRIAVLAALLLAEAASASDRPIVTELRASAGTGTRIDLSWTVPADSEPEIAGLLVYRSSKPIGSSYDLMDAEAVAELEPDASGWSDSVRKYSDFYYAVIAKTSGRVYDVILPSINATVNGVHLKLPVKAASPADSPSAQEKLYPPGTMRETPLPYLDLLEQADRTPLAMQPEAYAAARSLAGTAVEKRQFRPEPYIFEEDVVSPDGGDDFLLFEILRTTFIQRKYGDAAAQLEKLLGTNRSEPVAARATFYLGESYYFSGDYKKAAMTFLTVYDDRPAVAKQWIDAALDRISIPQE